MITRDFRQAVEWAVGRFVSLTTPLTSTSWDGDSYSSAAATVLDLPVVFGLPPTARAAVVRLIARDSAAWGTGDLGVSLRPNGATEYALQVRPAGGDVYAEVQGIVPCDSNGKIEYRIDASGASTMDIYIQIWGYWL